MGLRVKIFSAFFGILALLLGATLYLTNTQTTDFERARIIKQLEVTQKQFRDKFETERAATLKLVSTITSDQKYRSFLQQVRDNFFSFAEEIALDTEADLVGIVDEDLVVRGVNPPPADSTAVDAWVAEVERAIEADHFVELLDAIIDGGETDSRVMSVGGRLMNSVHVPLKESLKDDYALAVVSVAKGIDDAWVRQLLDDEADNLSVVFYIDGGAVAANVEQARRRSILAAAPMEAGRTATVMLGGERHIMLRGVFENAGRDAGYVFSASLDKAMEPFVALQWTVFLSGLGALGVGLVVVLFLTNRIVFPIRRLVQGTQEIMRGNYDYKVENRSKDEVGSLAKAFNHMTDGLKEKEQIRNLFGKYVHPSIVSDIMENPDNLERGGTHKVQTILFSDIEGFTTISEAMDADKLVDFLNEYLGAMADEISAHEGIVDKYLGDGIMAFWGEPFTKGNQAVKACRAALAMQNTLTGLRQEWTERGLPAINARIGLATGEVIVGNIGSEQSQDYTCIGDTVNLASRLEGANKFYGTRVIIDEATFEMAGTEVSARELDTAQVKGRESGTRIFELVELGAYLDAARSHLFYRYRDGLKLYRDGDFAAAEEVFSSLTGKDAGDPPSRVMAGQCRHYVENPPAEWTGIRVLEGK